MRSGLVFFLSVGLVSLKAYLPGTSGQDVTGGIPSLSTIQGSPRPLRKVPLGEIDSFTCLVEGVNPNSISMRWFRNNVELPSTSIDSIGSPVQTKIPEELYTISTLHIPVEDWTGRDIFACIVDQKVLPSLRARRTTEKDTENPSASDKSLFGPRFQENEDDVEVSFGCLAQGHLSKYVTVKWLKNTIPYTDDVFYTGEGNGVPPYKYTTITLVGKEIPGSNFSCVVGPNNHSARKTSEKAQAEE